MFSMTAPAGAHLAQLLEEADADADVAVRFVCSGQDLAMRLDNVQEGDATYQHDGRTVLVLAADVIDMVFDRELDVEDTDEGPQLALH